MKLRQILRHMLIFLLEEEKLKATKFRHRSVTEVKVHFCELKKGIILGDEDEVHRLDLMKRLEIPF
jgi:hypothetical protein